MRVPVLSRLNFTGQFVVLSLGILLTGMLTIGWWVQSAVERAVMSRTAAVTALYVDSFVGPVAQNIPNSGSLTTGERQELDRLITRSPLGAQIVSFKIWSPSGEVLYSPNPNLIGRTYEVDEGLRRALRGEVVSEMSDLTADENEYERTRWESLIETYAPLRSEGSGAVFGVSEFYELPDALNAEIRDARLESWAIVAIATGAMYLLLAGTFHRATKTIRAQRGELMASLESLGDALEVNKNLQTRVGKAAARTTTLNEQFLQRVSADIHDGPAQEVALALLRLDELDGNGVRTAGEVENLRSALTSALTELRAITHGLHVPGLDGLTPCGVARRAVADFERISGGAVEVDCDESPTRAVPSTNITIYRVIQESLANSFKHAGPAARSVSVLTGKETVEVKIADDGVGFEADEAAGGATLGLAGMRERVEVLGGSFSSFSQSGAGTVISAILPLTVVETDV